MDIVNASVRIDHILGETQLGKIVASKIKGVLKEAEEVRNEYVRRLGPKLKKALEKELTTKHPGGHKYVFLTPEGEVVSKHTASPNESAPNPMTGTLAKHIDCQIRDNTIYIGILSNVANPIGTKYYIPLTKKSISKKHPLRTKLWGYMSQGYRGAGIVGGRGTPVSEYAHYLEEGFTIKGRAGTKSFIHPFFKETLKKVIAETKPEYYKEMKRKIAFRTQQKITGHFKITIKV